MATYSLILCVGMLLLYIVWFTIYHIEVDILIAYQIGFQVSLVAIS